MTWPHPIPLQRRGGRCMTSPYPSPLERGRCMTSPFPSLKERWFDIWKGFGVFILLLYSKRLCAANGCLPRHQSILSGFTHSFLFKNNYYLSIVVLPFLPTVLVCLLWCHGRFLGHTNLVRPTRHLHFAPLVVQTLQHSLYG